MAALRSLGASRLDAVTRGLNGSHLFSQAVRKADLEGVAGCIVHDADEDALYEVVRGIINADSPEDSDWLQFRDIESGNVIPESALTLTLREIKEFCHDEEITI